MKRNSLLFALLVALFMPWAANAQETVTIGNGTSTDYYTPIGTYYNYSITEQLYTADEIGMAGTISSISFDYAGTAAKDFPITVYMANVEAEDLSTGISLADAHEVFNGTLSVTGAGWATIELDSPFTYDGTSNLLIGINKDYVYYYSGGNWNHTATEAVMPVTPKMTTMLTLPAPCLELQGHHVRTSRWSSSPAVVPFAPSPKL